MCSTIYECNEYLNAVAKEWPKTGKHGFLIKWNQLRLSAVVRNLCKWWAGVHTRLHTQLNLRKLSCVCMHVHECALVHHLRGPVPNIPRTNSGPQTGVGDLWLSDRKNWTTYMFLAYKQILLLIGSCYIVQLYRIHQGTASLALHASIAINIFVENNFDTVRLV